MSFLQEIKRRAFQIGISLIVLAGLFGLFSKEYMSFCRNHSEVQKLMNPFNYICSSIRYYKKELFKKRPFVILDAEPSLKTTEDQPRLVVMIVGETARASAFSLYGYERDTNPNLSKRTNLAVLNDVSSCGTATTVSLPCIFSAKQRPDFNVSEAKITQNLIDLAQLAGYDVLWLENDGGCKDVCNRVPTKDMRQIGDEKLCSSGGCYDEILFQGLEEKLSDLKQNTLIVLHMMGSHGPTYFERYPEQFQKFRPTCDTGDLKECTQQQIQNTYDNTILYTDYIIDQTIQKLENVSSHQTALVYVSDHGESLGENHIYLHGLPYRIAPANQTKVPLLLWFSKDFATRNRIDINSLQKSAQARNLSHDNLFHTMLDLLNVQSSVYQPSLDVLAFDPK
jgi:lipid A ethanolaminephosphotransferase